MTNAQIIMTESIRLMKEGKLKGTGETFTYEDMDGNTVEQEIPEVIHTYTKWKALGFQVQKGEKAVAKFKIWKHKVKKAKTEEEDDEEKMFMVESAFFTADQVKRIEG